VSALGFQDGLRFRQSIQRAIASRRRRRELSELMRVEQIFMAWAEHEGAEFKAALLELASTARIAIATAAHTHEGQ